MLTLIDDPSPIVRAAVARGLGFHRKAPAANDAIIQLLDDADADVRGAAAKACLHEGPSLAAVLPRLRELLDDENTMCRTCAAALVCTESRSRDTKAYTVLVEGLDAGVADVRVVAAWGLCDAASTFPEGFVVLRDAALKDQCVHSVFGVGARKFGPAKALPVLMEYLRESDSNERAGAAYALGELGADAKPAEPALVQALADPREHVRTAVRNALSKIDPERYPPKKTDH
jgi:HEAT repeat protein